MPDVPEIPRDTVIEPRPPRELPPLKLPCDTPVAVPRMVISHGWNRISAYATQFGAGAVGAGAGALALGVSPVRALLAAVSGGVLVCMGKSAVRTLTVGGETMTRGIYTSEFWLTIATAVLALVKSQWLPDIPEESFYAVIAYILSRGLSKKPVA